MKEKLSPQYNDAVKLIKTAILQSQAKALASVNQEQLALYYDIGRYISQNSRSGFWGKDAVEMTPGTVINIPAEVKHWHGAAPDSWFSHLAVEIAGEEASNEWLEAVSEEDYNKLK